MWGTFAENRVAPADLAAQIKAALKTQLPVHMRPQRIYAIAAIPRLPSAKTDMRKLEMLDRARQADDAQDECGPAHETAAGTTEAVVAAIGKRLFARQTIDRHADFFDLGGDSLMTLNMMFALEEELGVDLPVTAIFEAPTIASLAMLIESSAGHDASVLVRIKAGDGAPLVIVHGVGGTVMELFGFARRLDIAGPVYALQARGLDGKHPPHTTVAAMAEDYLAAIRAACPQGPCHLAGYSSGGLVAFEMARRLAQAGEPAASLTLLDTQTNMRQWPLAVWFDVLRRRLRAHGAAMRGLSPLRRLAYATGLSKGLWRRVVSRLGLRHAVRPIETEVEVPAALQQVYEAGLAAGEAYRPGYYPGALTIIRSAEGDPMMADPARIWPGRAARIEILTVPGTHFTMLQGENAAGLAQTMSQVLGRG